MGEEDSKSFYDIWKIIRKRAYIIVILTLTVTLITAAVNYFIISPTYEAGISMFIGNNYSNGDEKTQIDSVELYQRLMKTYVEIAKSNSVAEKTIEACKLNIPLQDFQKNITVTPRQDTQILIFSTKNKNPTEAVNIINSFAQNFIDEGKRLLPSGAVKILDNSRFPTDPISPNIKLNTACAFFLGLLGASAAAFIIELLDRTIRTEEDVERYINIPVIGLIFKENKTKKSQLVVLSDTKSASAEAYRTLRTNIEFSSIDKKIHTILITSAGPSEGKSTTAANLAIVMAQAGKKTLLIDCDLRKPNIHKIFEISNSTGLSNYLAGAALLNEVIKEIPNEKIYIITAGIKPPNPAELLSSEKMKQFIDIVKGRYDYVILDTPPVGLVTDAQILSQYADGCAFIISAGSTDRYISVKAKELLQKVNAKLLGVILNKVDYKALYGSSEYFSDYYSDYYRGFNKNKEISN